jgi:putative colanic acid biosynthesis UDP-glucose lipid carrier transferase
MADTRAGAGRLAANRAIEPVPLSHHLHNGVAHGKTVRLGKLEPVHVTLARQVLLPLVIVMTLAVCASVVGSGLRPEFYALALLTFFVAAQVFGPFEWRGLDARRRGTDFRFRHLLEWSCVVAIIEFAAVSFNLSAVVPTEVIVAWFVATPLAVLFGSTLRLALVRRLIVSRDTLQRFIIIGVNDAGVELARRIDQGGMDEKFLGFFDFRAAGRVKDQTNHHVTGSCEAPDFAQFVRENSVDRVYITLPMSTSPRIRELLHELRDTTASVYFVPDIFAFDLVQARCMEINGMPAVSICETPLHGTSGIWKRAVDIVLAVAALGLLWPAMLLAAIAIKQSSPGPVLFKQRRYGLNGEEILVYKFRSMTVCEDGPVITQATKTDARVTPVGAFLRRTSLDELPQIFNVLEGKMSFVGPRPHAVAHNEEYRKLISGYMIRHKVRPGITGWAQVNGLRGETSSFEKMHERVQYDLDYLKNWSLGLDMLIIFRTAMTVLRDRNAY